MAYEGDAQCYPLHAAALDGRAADLARALAAAGQELGAALTERDVHGRTALERAIECSIAKSATTCTRLLLAASDDVAAKDSFGDTALHLAASKHSPDEPELAGLLVGAGCDPAAKDQFGYTAIDIAKREHRPRVAAFLSAVYSNLETVVAPYRSEVAALRQLVADQGLERGLPAVVSRTVRLAAVRALEPKYDAMTKRSAAAFAKARKQAESAAETLAQEDRELPKGTPIYVEGRGRGSYMSHERQRRGANGHTIRFESGKTATVKLKEERWTVKDAEMEGAEEGVPPEPEPEAWEGVLASLALRQLENEQAGLQQQQEELQRRQEEEATQLTERQPREEAATSAKHEADLADLRERHVAELLAMETEQAEEKEVERRKHEAERKGLQVSQQAEKDALQKELEALERRRCAK